MGIQTTHAVKANLNTLTIEATIIEEHGYKWGDSSNPAARKQTTHTFTQSSTRFHKDGFTTGGLGGSRAEFLTRILTTICRTEVADTVEPKFINALDAALKTQDPNFTQGKRSGEYHYIFSDDITNKEAFVAAFEASYRS